MSNAMFLVESRSMLTDGVVPPNLVRFLTPSLRSVTAKLGFLNEHTVNRETVDQLIQELWVATVNLMLWGSEKTLLKRCM